MQRLVRCVTVLFLSMIMLSISPSVAADNNDTLSQADRIYEGTSYHHVCDDDECTVEGVDEIDYLKFYVFRGDQYDVEFVNDCPLNFAAASYSRSTDGGSSWSSYVRLDCYESANWYGTAGSTGYRYIKLIGHDDTMGDQNKIEIILDIDESNRNRDGDPYIDTTDDCDTLYGDSYQNLKGCPDSDNDGWADIEDDCPNDYDEYLDTDDDGYCDGDDEFPNDDTQWEDNDGDNYGDNSWGNQGDHFPNDPTQWYDNDDDGYGDNADGNNPDHCRFVFGNSYHDRNGCPDWDGDGYSDPDSTALAHPQGTADAFKYDASEWHDTDGDLYGDNSDQCVNDVGTSAFRIFKDISQTSDVGPLAADVVIGDRWGGDANNLTDLIYPEMSIADLEDETNLQIRASLTFGYVYLQSDTIILPLGAGSNYYFEPYYGCDDSDGDGVEDSTDQFEFDPTQWVDSDGDGFGDNSIHPTITEFNPLNCISNIRTAVNNGVFNVLPTDIGISSSFRYIEYLLCVSLGAENNDWPAIITEMYECDNQIRISVYSVNDGLNYCGTDEGVSYYDTMFNPNSRYFHHRDYDIGWAIPGANQSDACPLVAGTSTIDRFGCLDSDGDGYSDADDNWGIEDGADAWENDSSQWVDSDGDGYGDNPNGTNGDAFPLDPTQWSDVDGDGYGDNPLGLNPDAFSNDATQWIDTDGDGYGDNQDGNNPDLWPADNSQWKDSDGDGYGDNSTGTNGDVFPLDPTQWKDDDGDGFNTAEAISNCGDNLTGNNPDLYPSDPTQCTDTDGDGFGDNPNGTTMPDAFPLDATQWSDMDGDGYGDNGVGNQSDACVGTFGTSTIDRYGCPDSNGDGYSDMNGFLSTVSSKAANGDIGSILILAIIPLLLIVAFTVRKASQKKKDDGQFIAGNTNFAAQDDKQWAESAPPADTSQSLDPNDMTNWVKEYDQHGNLYYYNKVTKESKWEL